MAVPTSTTGFITTTDGVRLSYSQTGPTTGPNIIFIHGWRQSGAQWSKQVAHFSPSYRVTTYDYRGHGDSDKATFGHRVYRYAADLHDLLTQLHLRDAVVVAHSMGCAVIWAFWDLYGPAHAKEFLARVVFVDQSPSLVADPAWSTEEAQDRAAVFPPNVPYELTANTRASTMGLMKGFFTDKISQEDFDWSVEQVLKTSDETAAALLKDMAFIDWWDVFPRISIPSIVVAAEGSIFSVVALRRIGEQIPVCEVVEFKKEEGGSHFMFWENPEKFNAVVEGFAKK